MVSTRSVKQSQPVEARTLKPQKLKLNANSNEVALAA